MLLAAGEFQIVRGGFSAFAQHDVDGAGNGLRPGFGGGCAQNFNPLNLSGGQRLNGKTGGHALAIQQNLGIAPAQTPHADGAASARNTLHRDARQTFEHIAQGRVALFFDLFATDHDLGRGGFLTHFAVVVAVAADLDLAQIRGRCTGGRRLRRSKAGCREQPRENKA